MEDGAKERRTAGEECVMRSSGRPGQRLRKCERKRWVLEVETFSCVAA